MDRLLFRNAEDGERTRQRIRRDHDETVRRAKETIAHSKQLLREADVALTRVQFGDMPGSRSLNSCSHLHDYWLYANDKDEPRVSLSENRCPLFRHMR